MIGATEGKEPDHVQDEDLASLDELRGTMKAISAAALTTGERATVQGLHDEMQILKAMLLETSEQNNHLVNLYQTLKAEFNVFRANHTASLNLRVNSGSTTPEDIDSGPVTRSRD